LRISAEMSAARQAIAATSADDVPFAADQFSGMEVVDVRTDLDNLANKLMPNNKWHGNCRLRPLIPVVNVDVGAANSREQHSNFDVIDPDLRFGNIFQPQSRFLAAFDKSFHNAHFLPSARTHKDIGITEAPFVPERRLTPSLVSS
jgi:hypothetical protein